MAGMSTGGVGSGLDVASIVAQLVSADRSAPDARFDRTERQINAQVSAIGTLRGAFSALRSALTTLSSGDSARARKATVPEGAHFTASAASGAAVGQYAVEVRSLAVAHKLGSAPFPNADATLGSGTLKITSGDTTLEVTVDAEHQTLAGIRDAINAKAGGKTVAASIVTGDDGAHLVLTALDTGTSKALTVTSNDAALAGLTYPGGLSELTPASDALVKIDDYLRTSASNTLTDAISGVTLTLTKAATGTVQTFGVASDPTALRTSAKNFVNAYNASMGAIATTTAYNTTTQVAAALNGDSMVRGAARELRDTVSSEVTDLKAVGITINKDGTLKLDEAAFDAAMAKDPAPANRLFAGGTTSMAGRLDTALDHLLDDEGLLDSRSDALSARTKALAKQRSALDYRMTQAEARYRAQFTALDTLVTSLQSTSNFLSQQLSAL